MHVSPQKARLVMDMIRGRQAGEAINILSAVNKRIAPAVEKVLRSAIANAESKSEDVDVDKLFVAEAYVKKVRGRSASGPLRWAVRTAISAAHRTSW